MGPLLLGNLMELNEAQEGVLNIAFRVADEQGLLLLDLKDLRAMLTFLAENAADLAVRYGNVTKATVGAIQRGAAGAGAAGRRRVLRRAGARSQRLPAPGPAGAGRMSTCWPPTS